MSWRERFWPAVCEKFDIEATGEDISMRQYTLTVHDDTLPKNKIFHGEPARLNSFNTQKPYVSPPLICLVLVKVVELIIIWFTYIRLAVLLFMIVLLYL